MNLSPTLEDVLTPLFQKLELQHAMPELVPSHGQGYELTKLTDHLVKSPAIVGHPGIQAALWLYVDELDRSHEISQSLITPIGSYLHGMMHRREGDFWNSKYWFNRAGRIPGLAVPDPSAFVDRVASEYRTNPAELLGIQRQEWKAVFDFCVQLSTQKGGVR